MSPVAVEAAPGKAAASKRQAAPAGAPVFTGYDQVAAGRGLSWCRAIVFGVAGWPELHARFGTCA